MSQVVSLAHGPWIAECVPADGGRLSRLSYGGLVLEGETGRPEVCKAMLRKWLIFKAERHLVERLRDLSRELGLPFKKASIRGQKSRWGSCSTNASISLNYKVLFFPPNLADYVLIHELCHLRHPDHSKDFWALVGQYCPDYASHKRRLKKARMLIPGWAEPPGHE